MKADHITFRQDKRIVKKLDFILIPWLSLLYLVSFLDHISIGNAKIFGLTEDLNISNGQYNVVL